MHAGAISKVYIIQVLSRSLFYSLVDINLSLEALFRPLIYSKILFLSICNVVTWIAQEIFSFNKCNERHARPLHKHGHAQAHERYMCTLDQSFA